MKIAIIGSGVMGSGIAYTACLSRNSIALLDSNPDALQRAQQIIKRLGEKGIDRKKIAQSSWEDSFSNIVFLDDLKKAVENADLVIEAVTEDLNVKIDLFRSLDRFSPNKAVIASNTSSISITELAAATGRQEKVVGMHFFNPVYTMKLVEIVKGLETAEETVEIAKNAAKAMGKEPVIINEYPGFSTSRLIVLMGNEAFYALMEGVASAEDIDKAMRLGYNHPMGPFELVDLVGLDTRLNVLKYLHSTLGERFRPCPLLVKYVKAGRLGRKTGKGVYQYGPNGERLKKENF